MRWSCALGKMEARCSVVWSFVKRVSHCSSYLMPTPYHAPRIHFHLLARSPASRHKYSYLWCAQAKGDFCHPAASKSKACVAFGVSISLACSAFAISPTKSCSLVDLHAGGSVGVCVASMLPSTAGSCAWQVFLSWSILSPKKRKS